MSARGGGFGGGAQPSPPSSEAGLAHHRKPAVRAPYVSGATFYGLGREVIPQERLNARYTVCVMSTRGVIWPFRGDSGGIPSWPGKRRPLMIGAVLPGDPHGISTNATKTPGRTVALADHDHQRLG